MALIALESFTDNPIFTRELRRRMRGKVMMYMTNAFIAAMCLVTTFILLGDEVVNIGSGGGGSSSAKTGYKLYTIITYIQALLVLCIAPMITAGMATVERERKTFEFLKVTTLSPFTFIVGGLLSTMLYVLIVLLCGMPLICISFVYAGVSPGQIAMSFAQLLGASLLLSAAGLWISSTRERTKSAQGATLFLVIGALLVGLRFKDRFVGGPGGASAPPTFFGVPVPAWAVFAASVVFLSAFLLLIAARKLYNSDNRPLAYRHSLTLAAGLCLGFFGLQWGEPSLPNAVTWFWMSYPVLLLLVVTHCLHQLEVGNEAWQIKKRFKPLRKLDESLLFSCLLAAGWGVATVVWGLNDKTGSQSGPSLARLATDPALTAEAPHLLHLAYFAMASSLAFAAMAARFWAHYAPNRAEAFKKTLATCAVVFIGAPMAGWFMLYNTADHNPLYAALVMASPLGALRTFYYADAQTDAILVGGTEQLRAAAASDGLFLANILLWAAIVAMGGYYWNRYVKKREPVDYSYAL